MSYQSTDPAGAQKLLLATPPHVYVDVRTVEEFEQGHPPGAYNIPVLVRAGMGMHPNSEFVAAVQRHFPRDARIVFGCKSGGRSARACEIMAAQGYGALVNMDGGFHGAIDDSGRAIPGWLDSGLPVERETNPDRTWTSLSRAK